MTNHIKVQALDISGRQSLYPLGWSDHFERCLRDSIGEQHQVARVINVQRNLFLVTDGQREWFCSPAGRIIHSGHEAYPVTGDWVLVNDTVVTGVISRKNMLSRGEAGVRGRCSVGAVREQPIAANIDTVFIVSGLDRDFNLRRLERYLTLTYNCGLTPVVVLTKADLHGDPESFRLQVESIAFGVPVILVSMVDGRGKRELERFLGPGNTVAMIGSSGAGKSTLANMLYGRDIQAVRAVSGSVGKGRHTTTTRELIRMPQDGMLLDNPGIREIAFHEGGVGAEIAFADIRDLAEQCRFADCSHEHEPGCAVQSALERGELTHERLESYLKMKREMEYAESRRDKSADRVEKERWRDIALLQKQIKRRKRR